MRFNFNYVIVFLFLALVCFSKESFAYKMSAVKTGDKINLVYISNKGRHKAKILPRTITNAVLKIFSEENGSGAVLFPSSPVEQNASYVFETSDKSVFGVYIETGTVKKDSLAYVFENREGGDFFAHESEMGDGSDNVISVFGDIKGNIYASKVGYGSAIGNTVDIFGNVQGNVFAGYVSDKGKSVNNLVNIGGKVSGIVCGGYVEGKGNSHNGNTLSVRTSKYQKFGAVEVYGVCHFQYYRFNIAADIKSGDVLLIVLKGTGESKIGGIDDAIILADTYIELVTKDDIKLNIGDKICLIHSGLGFKYAPKNSEIILDNENAIYKFKIELSGKDLMVVLEEKNIKA